jgi:hypothetical protein
MQLHARRRRRGRVHAGVRGHRRTRWQRFGVCHPHRARRPAAHGRDPDARRRCRCVLFESSLVADFDCADDVALPTPAWATHPMGRRSTPRRPDRRRSRSSLPTRRATRRRCPDTGSSTNSPGSMRLSTTTASSTWCAPARGSRSAGRCFGANGAISGPESVESLTPRPIPCASETVEDVVEETTSSPGGLTYQGDGDRQYSWVTARSWARTCRELSLRLNGTTQRCSRSAEPRRWAASTRSSHPDPGDVQVLHRPTGQWIPRTWRSVSCITGSTMDRRSARDGSSPLGGVEAHDIVRTGSSPGSWR